MKKQLTYIHQLKNHISSKVDLAGWVYNVRSSGSLVFIECRDGFGICQCVVNKVEVSEESWVAAVNLKQESSIRLHGLVVADERSIGGVELQVQRVEILQLVTEYPITPKEHGIEFLMNRRHLWLRSQRQWAVMRVRNGIIFAIHNFFQSRGFIQTDTPIFTPNAAEGSTTLFETDFFEEKA